MAQQVGTNRPLRGWKTFGAVVVLGAAIALAACDAISPKETGCVAPTVAPAGEVAPADRAPGGGGLRVIEKGFTQLGDDRFMVSVGGVVENASAKVAYRVPITFRVLDADQKSVIAEEYEKRFRLEIPVILPGQKVPVGNFGVVRSDGLHRGAKVAALHIDLGPGQWLSFDDRFAQISTGYQGIERSAERQESAVISYSVNSRYCRSLVLYGISMVFRGADRSIVGGTFQFGGPPSVCRAGQTVTSTDTGSSVPLTIDEALTEVRLYCDFERSPTGYPTT